MRLKEFQMPADDASMACCGYSGATVRKILAAADGPTVGPMTLEQAKNFIRSIKPNHEQEA